MPSDTEIRASISEALNGLATAPILNASRRVFETLGYKSERRPPLPDSKPTTFLENFDGQRSFNGERGMLGAWKSADFLCQVTDEEIQLARKNQPSLLADGKIEKGNARSFAFLSIGLNEGTYTRAHYSGITREINRMFNMPAICLFKNNGAVTLSVIDRRQHKKESAKDVLEKVTLIKDIEYRNPHRGHVEILSDLALPNLAEKFPPLENFDHLLRAWRETLDISTLNKRFYRELSNWYFWALPQVRFPEDLEKNDEKLRATSLIRLLTRLIFCWFLKEKSLIPDKLFRVNDLANILKGFDPESEASSTYYLAILQNLFFATLNQRMGKDSNGNPYRAFAKDEGFQKNRSTYDVNNLYRYESLFKDDPQAALAHFADIPFLNGGLFECLDRTEEGTDKKLYLDGFSRNPKKRPHVPDRLFFDSGEVADLSNVYDDKKRKAERVTGLINILDRYKFTIVENTPIDEEVALDPELLGKVFENLLASYNEETKTTARKQTGSFYTPRPIVDYMVDESLKAHLTKTLTEKAGMKEDKARAGLDLLFTYTEKEHPFSQSEVATLIAAIDALKVLDPACGSGAFPMGMLHKLVYCLGKLDPENDRWKQTQLAKLDSAPMREELERNFADNNDDYGRKLYLIENCLYGVDIQPIAIQITKLRFFISLICDQKTSCDKAKNRNIKPLPNLETKFVAANSLIGLPEIEPDSLIDPRVGTTEKEIESLYHGHFSIQRRDQKLALQKKIKTLRQELGRVLGESLMAPKKAHHVAEWDPFDLQSSADFFEPYWMFGRALKDGFNMVIGNPPYLNFRDIKDQKLKTLYSNIYEACEYQSDLYVLFIEKAILLAKQKHGVVCLIVPNSITNNLNNSKIRKYILDHTTITSLVDAPLGVFESATVDNTILVSVCEKQKKSTIRCRQISGDNFQLMDERKQSDFLKEAGFVLNFLNSEATNTILQTIEKDCTHLGGICRSSSGIKEYETGKGTPPQTELDRETKRFNSTHATSSHSRKHITGSEVEHYILAWKNTYLEYGPWLAAPRDSSFFRGERIIIREIPGRSRLKVAYTSDDYTVKNTAHIFIPNSKSISLMYLLGILNSSLMGYYFRNKFSEKDGVFPKAKIGQCRLLPIKKPTPAFLALFGLLVPLIQLAKSKNKITEYAFLEDLIDACVMECYFREHMAERDLLFHDTVASHLAAYAPEPSAAQQCDYLTHLHQTLNAPSHPIRNRLGRITTDSPDLLAIIKMDGNVEKKTSTEAEPIQEDEPPPIQHSFL